MPLFWTVDRVAKRPPSQVLLLDKSADVVLKENERKLPLAHVVIRRGLGATRLLSKHALKSS